MRFKGLSFITVLLIGLFLLLRPLITGIGNPFCWDLFGYYLYLPLTFIHQDFTIADYGIVQYIQEQFFVSPYIYQIHKTELQNWVIRYPMGLAILQSPFYLLGHLYANITDYAVDGVSKPYRVALVYGGLVYFLCGMELLRRILLNYFSEITAAIVLVLVLFGTNLLDQVTNVVAGAHAAIFFLYALIIYQTIHWHKDKKGHRLLILGFFIGLTAITRPTAILIALVFLLWDVSSLKAFKEKLLSLVFKASVFLRLFIPFILPVLLQMSYWKLCAGSFIYNSYNNPGEGLDLLSPHLWSSLFSFRKGWFIYTPIMLVALFGGYLMIKNKVLGSRAMGLFILLNIYVVSSWTCWWYAGSYGNRAYTESYLLLAIYLGFFVHYLLSKKLLQQIAGFSLLGVLLTLNIFQYWQYSKGIIHDSRMTYDYYAESFLSTSKLDDSYDNLLVPDYGIPPQEFLAKYPRKPMLLFNAASDNELSSYYQGVNVLNKDQQFTKALYISASDFTDDFQNLFAINCEVKGLDGIEGLKLVSCIDRGQGKVYGYQAKELAESISDTVNSEQWITLENYYMGPYIRSKSDKLAVYFWYTGDKEVEVKNLEINVFKKIK